ncbi:MAG: O-antigen ligase family protein [Verrucomicrobiota bacterium]
MGSGSSRRRNRHNRPNRRRPAKPSKAAPGNARPTAFKSSIFTNPLPSRATVVLRPPEKPVFREYLIALGGIAALVLLGGSHNLFALGLALLLPGLWMLAWPPKLGLSSNFDRSIVVFLSVLLFAFIPQFYWPNAEWRNTATNVFGLELPAVLSLQPTRSFDAWLSCLAGIAWFYLLINFPISALGRKWIHFWVCVMIGGFATIVLVGNLLEFRYPGAIDATAFSFFPNRNQTTNLIAVGGVFSFAFGMEGFREKKVVNFAGLVATTICLGALLLGVSRAGILLYFAGILIWFIFRRRRSSISVYLKFGFPLVLLFFSIFISSNEQVVGRVSDFFSAPQEWDKAFRASIYKDTLGLIKDAPVTGVGMGNFEAVFPQYRDLSRNYQRVAHPESDFLWITSEGGLVALFALMAIGIYYFRSCRGLSEGKGGPYRVAALTALIVFILHSFVDVSAHRPGTAYFALFIAALSLPLRGSGRPKLPRLALRVVGGFLTIFGVVWIFSGISGAPSRGEQELIHLTEEIHKKISTGHFAEAETMVAERIASRPMDWQGYFQRAQISLSQKGNLSEAAADFRRARFVEPVLAVVSYEEGWAWIPYDLGRVVSAWRKTLSREAEDMDAFYLRMVRTARENPAFLERMSALSEISPHYRTLFVISLKDQDLMREIDAELARDETLSGFSPQQRYTILHRWILHGDIYSAEIFLNRYSDGIPDRWWLRALLYEKRAEFSLAIQVIRESIAVPKIPEIEFEASHITRLQRAFTLSKRDVVKGTTLLKYYLEIGDILKALAICEALNELPDPPSYSLYWQAEILYQLEDYVESWYSFKRYAELVL